MMDDISQSEGLALAGPYIGDELADLARLTQSMVVELQGGIAAGGDQIQQAARSAHVTSTALFLRLVKAARRLGADHA